MSSVNFKTLALQQLYTGLAGGAGATLMSAFRTGSGSVLATYGQDIQSLDSRIASFENVLIDAVAKAGSNPSDYPYDRASLKKEFMDEVLALLLSRSDYRASVTGFVSGGVGSTAAFTAVTSDGFLRDAPVYGAVAIYGNPLDATQITGYSQGTNVLLPAVKNFNDLTEAEKKQVLNSSGDTIYDQYSALIDAIFAEGDKLKNNPVDLATGVVVTANVITAITDREVGGVTFNGVTTINGLTYLVEKGATTYDVTKNTVTNQAGQPVDFRLGFDSTIITPARYIRCDANGDPVGSTIVTFDTQRNLSPMQFLYFFNEARIKILRAQLAYKEAVVNEIRDDLIKAQAAYSDLEKQAGQARDRSEDGKTLNPNAIAETVAMDFWEARSSKAGTQLLDGGGTDDQHNFTDWQKNRSQVKNYIDQKSTQSQDAMLDYQTVLNRYNGAYEVMSKLQEKLDGLVKSQLRNVA